MPVPNPGKPPFEADNFIGSRLSLLTQPTRSVRRASGLVQVAKPESGITDGRIDELTANGIASVYF